MPYYVYMLRCRDGSLYTGLTTDPPRRLDEHNAGGPKGARYTRARRPVELAWLSAPLPDRSSAGRLEARLKAMTRPQKLRWMQQAPHQEPDQEPDQTPMADTQAQGQVG